MAGDFVLLDLADGAGAAEEASEVGHTKVNSVLDINAVLAPHSIYYKNSPQAPPSLPHFPLRCSDPP